MDLSNKIALISVLASSATAIIAVVGSVITAIINSRNSRKTKSLELFFNAKVSAYSELLEIIADASISDYGDLKNMFSACSKAQLFSSDSTGLLIKQYGDAWTTAFANAKHRGTTSLSQDESQQIDESFFLLLPALNQEISLYSK